MTALLEPTEAEIWHVARAISIPEHHTTWDLLTERQKDLYFLQADYAISAMRSSAHQEPDDALIERLWSLHRRAMSYASDMPAVNMLLADLGNGIRDALNRIGEK